MKIADAVEEYVLYMNQRGFAYRSRTSVLRGFSRFVGESNLETLESCQVEAFLSRSPNLNSTWLSKHALLTNFFAHWCLRGHSVEAEMPVRRPRVPQEFFPYVYSNDELRVLLHAASLHVHLNHALEPETLRVVLLFLYATGTKVSEVVHLTETDVDAAAKRVFIRETATTRKRTIPISPELLDIVEGYISWKRCIGFSGPSLFIQRDGRSILKDTIYRNFRKLLRVSRLYRRDGVSERPRLQDLRFTFAVHRITAWIHDGADLDRLLPALSAYMGQKDLTGTERLLKLAPDRFKKELDKLSPDRP
jgi:integrase/recombinase XerD